MVLPRSSQWQRNAAGVHRTMARGSLPGAGRRTRSLSGHPWAETWGRPASEFPSLPSCPLGAPLPADLTWHQEEAAQPARHSRRPGHGPVRQPRGRPRPSRNLRRVARPLPSGSLRPHLTGDLGREGGLKRSALRSHPGLLCCPSPKASSCFLPLQCPLQSLFLGGWVLSHCFST